VAWRVARQAEPYTAPDEQRRGRCRHGVRVSRCGSGVVGRWEECV